MRELSGSPRVTNNCPVVVETRVVSLAGSRMKSNMPWTLLGFSWQKAQFVWRTARACGRTESQASPPLPVVCPDPVLPVGAGVREALPGVVVAVGPRVEGDL